MNNVQYKYTPPRFLALCLGGIIFAVYHLGWRPTLLDPSTRGAPVPLVIAIAASLVLGYGIAMLGWLLRATKGQVRYTFRPTRGRIIGAFCLAMVTPIVVFSYLPWVMGGLAPLMLGSEPLFAIAIMLMATALTYPLAAMIVRHTYDRRWLRLGLFALSFWTAYAGHLLYSGEHVFRL